MQSNKKGEEGEPAAVTVAQELDLSSDSEAGMSDEEEEVSSGKQMLLLGFHLIMMMY